MKALSIRQPHALLIVAGIKDIENRTWPTKYRGHLLIHASKKIDTEAMKRITAKMSKTTMFSPLIKWMTDGINHYRGGIIGEVELVDCVDKSDNPWCEGPYGFVLKHAKHKVFTPLRGKLGIFEVDIV